MGACMDVTSVRSCEQLQQVVRDPLELLRAFAELDKNSVHNLVSSHISSRNEENRPIGGGIQRAVYQKILRNDAVVVASPAHGIPPKSRGLRAAIRGDRPSNKSLAEVALLLGNCEPIVLGMITCTMTDVVHALFSVDTHRQVLRGFLDVLRRRGFGFYVWVREFQTNGSVHWHIFVCKEIVPSGLGGDLKSLDADLSRELSECFTRLYARRTSCPFCKAGSFVECEAASGKCILGGPFRRMVRPIAVDKIGCVHAEAMRSQDAAARYASKEAGKRFQKRALDSRWRDGKGGAWWRAGRGFTMPDYGVEMVAAESVARCKFKTESGFEIDAPYRIQHGKGLLSRDAGT